MAVYSVTMRWGVWEPTQPVFLWGQALARSLHGAHLAHGAGKPILSYEDGQETQIRTQATAERSI